jgi:hypothetical protein
MSLATRTVPLKSPAAKSDFTISSIPAPTASETLTWPKPNVGIILKEKIFYPLGMKDSGYTHDETNTAASCCGVLYKQAVGLANREWNIPNDLPTKFEIGSMTCEERILPGCWSACCRFATTTS